MRYLGIDYGKKKMGLAGSDGQIASPIKVIKISGLIDAVNKTAHVVKTEEVERVVVGVPESGEAHNIAKKFIDSLKKLYETEGVEVIEADETLSSLEARQLMIDLNIPQKRRNEEDAYAAVLILQRFLNSLEG